MNTSNLNKLARLDSLLALRPNRANRRAIVHLLKDVGPLMQHAPSYKNVARFREFLNKKAKT